MQNRLVRLAQNRFFFQTTDPATHVISFPMVEKDIQNLRSLLVSAQYLLESQTLNKNCQRLLTELKLELDKGMKQRQSRVASAGNDGV